MTLAIIFIGCALLLLAFAVVVLFAMIGSLASKLPEYGTAALPEIALGARPESIDFDAMAISPDHRFLLVLSTLCSTCRKILTEISESSGVLNGEIAIILIAGNLGEGNEVLDDAGLAGYPAYVDLEGDWTKSNLGLAQSPSLVVISNGHADAAFPVQRLADIEQRVRAMQPDHTR